MDFDELDDFELIKARDELREKVERARLGKGFATAREKELEEQEVLEKQAEAERLQAEEEAAELERLRLEEEAKLASLGVHSYTNVFGTNVFAGQPYLEDDAETEGNESEAQEESEEESVEDVVREAPPATTALPRPRRGNFSSMLAKVQETSTTDPPVRAASAIASQDASKRSSRGRFSSMLEKAAPVAEVVPSTSEESDVLPSLHSLLAGLERDALAEVEVQADIAESRQSFFGLGQRLAAEDEQPQPDRQEELRADYEAWLNRERRPIDEDELDMHLDADRPTRFMMVAAARRQERETMREERRRRIQEGMSGAIFGDHKARVQAVTESAKAALGDGARNFSAPIMPRSHTLGAGSPSFSSGLSFGPGVTADVGDVSGLESSAPLPRRAQTKAPKTLPVTLVQKKNPTSQVPPSSQRVAGRAAAGELASGPSASSSSVAWKRRGAAAKRRETPAASSSSTSP